MKLIKYLALTIPFLIYFPIFLFSDNDRVIDLIDTKKPYYSWSSSLQLGYFQPIGNYKNLLDPALMLNFNLSYNPKIFNYFLTELEIGYASSTFKNNKEQNYQILPIGLMINYNYPLIKDFNLFAKAGGGEYIFKTPAETAYKPYFKTGAGFSYHLTQNLTLSAEGNYYYMFDDDDSIQAVSLFGSFNYIFGTVLSDKDVKIISLKTEKIFSSLYTQYYKNPIGVIKIKNTTGKPLRNVEVSIYIKNFMDNKSTTKYPKKVIKKDEVIPIPLYTYFNNSIKNIENDINTTGIIEISYIKADGRKYKKRDIFKTTLYSRNALIWDDLAKLGAFISPKDKTVIEFSRKAISTPIPEKYGSFPKELITTMKVFEALKSMGMKYVNDPTSPYEILSGQPIIVDYVQYPEETLLRKSGDCDDLTVLVSSLLESMKIPTALVTIPGHIFLLVKLENNPTYTENFITYENNKWIPLEITNLKNGFTSAWLNGYKNYTTNKKEEILLVKEAMKRYNPLMPTFSQSNKVDFNHKIHQQLCDKEIQLITNLYTENSSDIDDIDHLSDIELNKKGIIFAKTANYKYAEILFKKAIEKNKKFKYAYLNLMNLFRIKKEYNKIIIYYKQISTLFPDDGDIDIFLSKIEFLRKNFLKAKSFYSKATQKKIKPKKERYISLINNKNITKKERSSEYEITIDWEF